jgi:glyoxalase family protein
VLGLRMVKKTVNYDQPDVYHLYYGDERGTPGTILTFFEFPGARLGRHGEGMVHTVSWRVADDAGLDFWAARLEHAGLPVERRTGALHTTDREGLGLEILSAPGDPALAASAPDIPAEHALQGFHGVRAYARGPGRSEHLLRAMDLEPTPGGFSHSAGGHVYVYDNPPDDPGIQGAGSVHHIAWASRDEDHLAWQERIADAGGYVTDVRDRDYFRSIYFAEPRGVLFEIATLSPGFAVDEDPEHLGEALKLPRQHEHLRAQLESMLRPVENPRTVRA